MSAHYALVRALASGTAEIDSRETIDAAYVDGRFYAAKPRSRDVHPALVRRPPRRRPAGSRRSEAGVTATGPVEVTSSALGGGRGWGGWGGSGGGPSVPRGLLLLVYLADGRVATLLGGPNGRPSSGADYAPFRSRPLLRTTRCPAASASPHSFRRPCCTSGTEPARWLLVGAARAAGRARGRPVEFPLGIVAVVLKAGYAARARAPAPARGPYAAGLFGRVLPRLAYNSWAFGSPIRLSYIERHCLPPSAGDGAPVRRRERRRG
jgi:hypothetical protein